MRTRNNFSKIASVYAKYRRDYIDRVYDLIYSFCPDKESDVLDVGCGTGFVTNHLAHYYKYVTGVDKSREMIKVAQKSALGNTHFVVASIEQLPFENNSFNLVTAGAAYHWFDYDKAGKEILRVLKNEGKLCVFWKYSSIKIEGYAPGYLPQFAVENLRHLVKDIPHTNKEEISKEVFLRTGFAKVDVKEFDFDDVYSKEEILGYIQSHSTFNLLGDEQKEEYKKLNEACVNE